MAIEKIKPNADADWTNGNDGKDGRYYIKFTCPGCGREIRENQMACGDCGTFFDWRKQAYIKCIRVVEWR